MTYPASPIFRVWHTASITRAAATPFRLLSRDAKTMRQPRIQSFPASKSFELHFQGAKSSSFFKRQARG